MISVCVRSSFSAAHRVEDHPGECRELHGHNYVVELCVSGELNEMNMVMDFADLKRVLRDVLKRLDHKFLNEVMGERNATVELIALYLWREVRKRIPKGLRLRRIRVFESEDQWAEIEE